MEAILESAAPGANAAAASVATAKPKAHQVIKLGVDVHLDRYVVVRQIDGGAPQPAQRFSPEQFLAWVKKQTELAEKVYSCYEAGPFGYSLHRKLATLGVTNYVVRPRDWDEYGQKVKTDKRDAKQLVLHLDRYLAGNRDAFCVVRVPTEAEEQARSRSRQRESLQKEKQRLAAQGRSHALYYGARSGGCLVDRSAVAGTGRAPHGVRIAGAAAPADPGGGAGTPTAESSADEIRAAGFAGGPGHSRGHSLGRSVTVNQPKLWLTTQ